MFLPRTIYLQLRTNGWRQNVKVYSFIPCLSVCFRGYSFFTFHFSLFTSYFSLSLPLHRFKELGVALGGLQLVEQKFHGGQFVHGVQQLA
jgi:hypothetical protein